MTDPLRFGVVGVGALAIRAVVPHLAADDLADKLVLTALCDPIVDRAQSVAQEFGVPHVYSSLSEMIDADVVDAVTIVSPIGLHYEHVRESLRAGLHVHVNKTMTTTVAEADEVINIARARGLTLIASPGEVLRPQITAQRELIRSGRIGKVAWGICGCAFEQYHEDEPERQDANIDPTWYFRSPGGGPMYDMTAYALHQLTGVLGPALAVTGMSGQLISERAWQGNPVHPEVDDNTTLLLEFPGGAHIIAYGTPAGWTTDQFGATIFYGTNGTLEGVLLNGQPIDFALRDETLQAPLSDWESQMRVLPHVTGRHREIPESHVFEDIMQLVHEVQSGHPSPVTAEHARHVIDIIESGYMAAETGTRQDLTTDFAWPVVDAEELR